LPQVIVQKLSFTVS